METQSALPRMRQSPIWSRKPIPFMASAVATRPALAQTATMAKHRQPQQQPQVQPFSTDVSNTSWGAPGQHDSWDADASNRPQQRSGGQDGSNSSRSSSNTGASNTSRSSSNTGASNTSSNSTASSSNSSANRHGKSMRNSGSRSTSSSSSGGASSSHGSGLRIVYTPIRLDALAAKYFPSTPNADPPTTPTRTTSPSHSAGSHQPQQPKPLQHDAATQPIQSAAGAAVTSVQPTHDAATGFTHGMEASSPLASFATLKDAPATAGGSAEMQPRAAGYLAPGSPTAVAGAVTTAAPAARQDSAAEAAATHQSSALRHEVVQQASSSKSAYAMALPMAFQTVGSSHKRRRRQAATQQRVAAAPPAAADGFDEAPAALLQLRGPAPARLSFEMEQLLCKALQDMEVLKKLKPSRRTRDVGQDAELKQWAAAAGMAPKELQDQVRAAQMATQVLPAAYAGLIVSTAKRMATADILIDDLIAEGREGLLQAALQYRPESGARLATFARWHVSRCMQRLFVQFGNAGHMHLPRHIVELRTPVLHAYDNLSQRLGRKPTMSEVAAEAGISVSKAEEVLQMTMQRGINLDAPLTDDEGAGATTAVDQLRSVEEEDEAQPGTSQGTGVARDAAAVAHEGALANEMDRMLSQLNARDAAAVRMRLGLGPGGNIANRASAGAVTVPSVGHGALQDQGMSVREVAEVLGVSRQRGDQLVARGLAQLKTTLTEAGDGSRELEALLAAAGVTVRRGR